MNRKDWARRQAAALGRFLRKQGIEITRSTCLEAIAAMHGAREWKAFEASPDADIEVRDPNALNALAEVAVESCLFSHTQKTLHKVREDLVRAQRLEEEEAARSEVKVKSAFEQALSGVTARELAVPPTQLPALIDTLVSEVTLALQRSCLPEPTEARCPRVFTRTLRDWRAYEGEELPVADARTYAVRVINSDSALSTEVSFPYKTVEDLPENSPQLAVNLEINEGVPCAHLFADIVSGEALISVFAWRNQLIVRFNEKVNSALSFPLGHKFGLDHYSVIV